MRGTLLRLVSLWILGVSAAPAPSEPTPATIRSAADKAIPLIRKSVEEYPRHRECFSCHHQAIPALALSLAKARGIAIGGTTLQDIAAHTQADLESALDDYKKEKGQPGGSERAGYALFTLETAGHPRDEVTDAVAGYLLAAHKDRDHWRTQSNRPPSEASDFTATYLAVRALQAFGTPDQKDRVAGRLDAARSWLRTATPRDNEDRVFRLFAVKAAGMPADAVEGARSDLLSRQNDDGGWAQLDGNASDAYATGSALVALHLAGGVPADDRSYLRGLSALIGTQRADGSWLVVSRSKPFQTYFESGFPHGKDQFISVAASSWAASALLLAVPRP
ncbi:MAG: terpene cyclase/mutase family protein [Paludisphaera borealis]|uniref:prenyltransferase/squalene oxidase repeat-containing protein n=1 Tax=Paludisphaera borealis TaxID=1387353 RepID=UPI0028510515|nr:terpene cyclase/mutase family protein [Paludisphaera borealis]MDR3618597.1 terpene cyclase/mutase family protein [Paludisphaera borealis]